MHQLLVNFSEKCQIGVGPLFLFLFYYEYSISPALSGKTLAIELFLYLIWGECSSSIYRLYNDLNNVPLGMPVGVVLINLIGARRPILIVGSAFPFPEWEILHCERVKKASWTPASCTQCSCLLAPGTVWPSTFSSPCLDLWQGGLDSWTVSQENPFCPSCFCQGFYYSRSTRNQVSQHICECWRCWPLCSISLVYVLISLISVPDRSV